MKLPAGSSFGPVVGKCYVCSQPVRAKVASQVFDPTVGWDRRVHRGACKERAEVLFTPKVEGRDKDEG